MGQEINDAHFSQQDFARFRQRLQQETDLLAQWFDKKRFSDEGGYCGFELEAWLLDSALKPACINKPFLETWNNPLASPELACFNIELNYTPRRLHSDVFQKVYAEMQQMWIQGSRIAAQLDAHLMMIGILPTVSANDLVMENISAMKRYQALNDQVLSQRKGKPFRLDIHGHETLRVEHTNVMLESATTSFQIHLQVPLEDAVRAYNASIIASAPLVAVSANSPFLFTKNLWSETRIPLFEQAVEVGGYDGAAQGPMRRVTFGSGYARESLFECFKENMEHYPALLPTTIEDPLEKFSNVRLHNGTLWRWNRPLIGIEDGTYHLRIEQRVVPAGPSIIDTLANAAFYYGLVYQMCQREIPCELALQFNIARDNFYHAAQHGLDSQITWFKNKRIQIAPFILDELLPMCASGLSALSIDQHDINWLLGIIERRVHNRCNGSSWQRAFVSKYGNDMTLLTREYLVRQKSGAPVHEWDI